MGRLEISVTIAPRLLFRELLSLSLSPIKSPPSDPAPVNPHQPPRLPTAVVETSRKTAPRTFSQHHSYSRHNGRRRRTWKDSRRVSITHHPALPLTKTPLRLPLARRCHETFHHETLGTRRQHQKHLPSHPEYTRTPLWILSRTGQEADGCGI